MSNDLWLGVVVAVMAGLIMGTSPWPLKLMRHFRYEQFGFVSMLVALVILPWTITLASCPEPWAALQEIDRGVLLKANAFECAWGVAQVLAMLCFVRIGVSLTYGILCSIGAMLGVIVPMLIKAPGVFQDAPDLFSRPGVVILGGMSVMLIGIVLASLAGINREKMLNESAARSVRPSTGSGTFTVGLVMVVLAGVLSVGWGLAFAYCQDPIIRAMKLHGATDLPAGIAVWAVALLGAALPNVIYPAMLMTKNKSWNVLLKHPGDIGLSVLYGILFFVPSVLLGKGMLLFGAFGASIGWGLVQGTIILGGQFLGLVSGEWRGVGGRPLRQMSSAIILIITAMAIVAYAKMGV